MPPASLAATRFCPIVSDATAAQLTLVGADVCVQLPPPEGHNNNNKDNK